MYMEEELYKIVRVDKIQLRKKHDNSYAFYMIKHSEKIAYECTVDMYDLKKLYDALEKLIYQRGRREMFI